MQFTGFTQEFLERYDPKNVPWGFSGLGYIVYKRCVTVDTPVLCGDLTWRPVGDLKEGDSIVGFDENPKLVYNTKKRYYRTGKVMYNAIEKAPVMGVELEDGTIVYATHDHPWLVKFDGNSTVFWRETKDLAETKYGNPVYLLRPFGKPWETATDYEAGYLAAAFDGEGHADGMQGIIFTQVENEMLEKVEIFLANRDIPFTKSTKLKVEGRQTCYQLRWYDTKNIVRFLGEVQAPRISRKFLEKLATEPKEMRVNPDDLVRVVRVFDAGEKGIAVLSTDIATHFTAGFASHNTYARIMSNGQLEEWPDTIKRCIEGAQAIGANYTQEEAERLFDHMFNLRGLFGGRFLWQLGTKTVEQFGKSSLVNCWYVPGNSIDSFCFAFDMLMTGGGGGFSVKRSDINDLPKVKRGVTVTHVNTKDADFIVPDSRMGWVSLLRKVLESYFKTNESFTYSTILIRGAGEVIKGFGGKASGPLPLIEGIEGISTVLQSREGKKLRSVDVLDIFNILGSIVVAGNVRRSAEVALGDSDDILFLRAKNWALGNIPNHRAMSNNTIYADSFDYTTNDFWNGYTGSSEPYGLFNLSLAQRKGRLNDPEMLDNCEGGNPCMEITLAPYESCVLAELVLPNIRSQEELNEIARLLYKTQKAAAALPSHWKQVNDVVSKNMRIGLGVTGILQSQDKVAWLDECYAQLREYDKVWSATRGWNESIKLSTIKPSGTLSLLAGVTPGIHPALYRYYIRRVRIASNDPLIQTIKDSGYAVEYARRFDGSIDYGTMIASFPCKSDDSAIVSNELTAIEQLEWVARLQSIWADNAVSCTVYYTLEELDSIKLWLSEHYEDSIKSVSFLLRNDHGFDQAPYEEIDEDTYNQLMQQLTTLSAVIDSGGIDLADCDNGACPIK